jgi:hypothetical protein
MPATISSCLNSCGDCGSAYHGAGLEADRDQEVAGALGVDRVSVGVSISLKSRACSTSRAIWLARLRRRSAGGRTGTAQVEVAVLEPQVVGGGDRVVDRQRQRRGLGEHGQLAGDHLDAPVARSGFSLPPGAR